ncbi:MAG: type IX secretion system membrane protein PorP/SprF [Bacteroidales bacterium]|nr:type IX secretion system membrane protein PorP/SprF [Bacteroidales bacterium]
MKKHHYISLLFTMLVPSILVAQDSGEFTVANQYPIYSQYLLDGLVINPAYAGTRDALSISLTGRKKMLGFSGESSMQSLSLHAPLKKERIALGLSVSHITYGVTEQTSFYGYYAYHIKGDKGLWSLAIKAGADMTSSDYSGVTTADPGDPVFEGGNESYIMPNVGTGVYYKNKKFFAGIAVPALLTYKSDTLSSGYRFEPDYNYYDILFSAGALVSISESFKIKPSVLVKYSMTNSLRLDLNTNFILYDFLWFGVSWRIGEEALVGIVAIQISQQFRLGYSYDYSMGVLAGFSGGTHEVGLMFDFGKKVTAANPRYF